MTPHARRKALQRAEASKADVEREIARQIALAVSVALKKAEEEASALAKEEADRGG
jgi:hypothetical protein